MPTTNEFFENAAIVERIVSGGQTGVDQGALLAAIDLQIEHGGWCPKGRICEDGQISLRFQLKECHSSKYSIRTEQNVIDSDGTLILYRNRLSAGSALTRRMAIKQRRPLEMVDFSIGYDFAQVRNWLIANEVKSLYIAGPRECSEPGICQQVHGFLHELLAP